MAYEKRDMTGTLFKNDKREKDSHPHATGTAIIDGVEFWISAWTKEGSKGKFQSLAFKRKEERRQEIQSGNSRSPAKSTSYDEDLNDDIPF